MGPECIQAESANYFTVVTQSAAGKPRSAAVE